LLKALDQLKLVKILFKSRVFAIQLAVANFSFEQRRLIERATFARGLINSQVLEEFVSANFPRFSSKAIALFAQSQNRHPGIIIGCLQYDGKIPYKNHRKYLVKVGHFLTSITDTFAL
jgi:hypothetical protein